MRGPAGPKFTLSSRPVGETLWPVLRRFSDAGTHDANHALRRPASEKRQGTKSRWGIVGGAATMGISPREVRFASGSFCTADGRDVHNFCVVAQGLQKKGVSRFVLCVISMS